MTDMSRLSVFRNAGYGSDSRVGVLPAVSLAVLAIPAVFGAIALQAPKVDDTQPGFAAAAPDRAAEPLALDTRLMPISREEAERLNAMRPADAVEVSAATPFIVAEQFRDDPRFELAVDCLAQAVYYEAGSENDAGQRAVAQVVLNRVRHPAFPNTVCGVVYQGSDRQTGCQFTFTCDGSLVRPPSASGWRRARRVALAALSGWVEPRVGTSTHYHASYVLPYWAGSLDKVLTVGAHNFYAMRGSAGGGASFAARYDLAGEFVPPGHSAALLSGEIAAADAAISGAPESEAPPPPSPIAEDRLAARSRLPAEASGLREPSRIRLRADENRGDLSPAGGDSELLVD